jgi:hypothetical protein
VSKFALTARLLAATATIIGAAFAVSATAQTTGSTPDFSSNQTAWQIGNGIDFMPLEGSPPLVRNDARYPYVSNAEAGRTGKQPTYRISDLTNPNLTDWAKAIMKKDNDEVLAGKIPHTPGQSCVPSGVPYYMLSGGPFYFLQTPKQVWIIESGERQARRVYMNVPHSANPKPSWYGESVGRYEGDTLVIDTIGLNAKTFVDNYRTPHSEKLHVVERFRVSDDGKALEYRVSVDDPQTYKQPWQAMRRFNRVQTTMGEEICREGNFILFDYGIPVDNTADF